MFNSNIMSDRVILSRCKINILEFVKLAMVQAALADNWKENCNYMNNNNCKGLIIRAFRESQINEFNRASVHFNSSNSLMSLSV